MTPSPTAEQDIVERLQSNAALVVCPFDRKSPDYFTTPNDKPCKFCGSEPEGPDKCTGADLRILLEAADLIASLRRENEAMKVAPPHLSVEVEQYIAEVASKAPTIADVMRDAVNFRTRAELQGDVASLRRDLDDARQIIGQCAWALGVHGGGQGLVAQTCREFLAHDGAGSLSGQREVKP